jgi:hypothetical protein
VRKEFGKEKEKKKATISTMTKLSNSRQNIISLE